MTGKLKYTYMFDARCERVDIVGAPHASDRPLIRDASCILRPPPSPESRKLCFAGAVERPKARIRTRTQDGSSHQLHEPALPKTQAPPSVQRRKARK